MAFFTKRLDRRIAAYQQELLETHYREVENMYREMRGWRYDYRNHIQLLKMYAQNGDLDAIRAYLDALETDLTRVDTVVKTGNRMADAILNSKISLAKSKHIPVRADAHIPVALAVSDLDLCVILGNLLENALEACARMTEGRRFLRLVSAVHLDTLTVTMDNSFDGHADFDGERFRSSKRDDFGVGLGSIRAVARKRGGDARFEPDGRVFRSSVYLRV